MKKKGDKDKVVEYIPAVSDLQTQNWWQYRIFSQEQIQKIEDFFTTYTKDLPNSMTTNIYDNVKFVCNALGLQLHPVFQQIPEYFEKEWKEQESQISQEISQQQDASKKPIPTAFNPKKKQETDQQQNTREINFIIFHGITIDYGTARVLQYVLQFSPIGTFKFHHNNFDKETLEVISKIILNQSFFLLTFIFQFLLDFKMKKLIFEWNPSLAQIDLEFYPKLATLTNLQFLVLRCNQINNENIKQFCEALKSCEASQLKCLDLFDNQISKEGIDAIGQMLATHKFLEYLCLGKNKIENPSDIEGLVLNIGKQFLSESELIDFREQEKRISQIIETNKKIKKKELQEHVPYLEPVQEQDGKFFHMRNNKLQLLNLSMNNLDEQSKDFIEKLLKSASESFQIILNFNKFEDKTRENMKKNYKKQIFI